MELSRPREDVSVRNILAPAAQYRDAAFKLVEASPKTAHPPLRLLALRSIELYLNALLLAKGLDHTAVGGLQHDLGERSRVAIDAGLVLRKRTAAHLATLSSNREYQLTRYAPALAPSLSQVNRMMATLDEVSKRCERWWAHLRMKVRLVVRCRRNYTTKPSRRGAARADAIRQA